MCNGKRDIRKMVGFTKVIATTLLILIFLYGSSANADAICSGLVKIKELAPRDGGWVHIIIENVSNADLQGCGNNSKMGLLLNYNDTSSPIEGKKMLFATVMAAKMSGTKLNLCSTGCDTQHPKYSRLSFINNF
jgi:hypothetical protein